MNDTNMNINVLLMYFIMQILQKKYYNIRDSIGIVVS